MKLSVLIAFLFVLAVSNAYPSNSASTSEQRRKTKSWFGSLGKIATKFVKKLYYWNDKCHDLECPNYELKKKTDDYELRCYSKFTWVGTRYVGKFNRFSIIRMMEKRRYIVNRDAIQKHWPMCLLSELQKAFKLPPS